MDNYNYPAGSGQGNDPYGQNQNPNGQYTYQPDGQYAGRPAAQEGDAWKPAATPAPVHQAAQSHHYPGWEYYNNAWHAVPRQQPAAGGQGPQAEPPPQKPEKKRGKGALRAVALMLACLVCGFGGGYAALNLYEPPAQTEPTVVYKAPENSGSSASGVNNASDLSVSDVAAMAGESVVSITTENEVRDYFMGGRVVSGAGSGVIISEDGYILTNHHVIDGASNVIVTLPDGTEYPATLVGSDQRTDVAVIKINVTGLTPAVIGDSDTLKVGEFCLAIGNPMGTLGGTVTNGIISALNREITIDGNTMNLLQMSAAVSPGNSGGGLFNAKGELVGVVNAKSGGEDTEGLGFAIPSNTAIKVAEELMTSGYVTGRPGLGVNIETFASDWEASQAGHASAGVYIASINSGSPAEAAGLWVGDKVVMADGNEITDGTELSNAIAQKKVGDTLELVVERNGHQMNITVTLGELKG